MAHTPSAARSIASIVRRMTLGSLAALALTAFTASIPGIASAQDKVLNLYSARHYQTDEALYQDFTRQTGIRINRIEAGDEALLERLRSEGANSPADVLLLVDAARLWRAQIDGLFQPVKSTVLEARIPAHLRARDDGKGSEWVAFSTRARIIVYNKDTVDPKRVRSYQDLAHPALKGKVCTRSGSHPYMLSLIGSIAEHHGEAQAQQWAAGVVANFARPPRGGDTDQIKAVASGECGVALTNTYYLVRMMRSTAPADQQAIARVGMVWPNQDSTGTHINVSGGGVLKHARNRDAAVRFMEYLASDSAQAYLANGNNEWPVVPSALTQNPTLESLGSFKADTLPVSSVGKSQVTAAKIIDRVGWR
jgi:iron(III) transport system substrate-binding protein